ncbi:MAG: hypothetical protein GY711_19855 [bacterium]|nr:hypothetical protein [bacterium]
MTVVSGQVTDIELPLTPAGFVRVDYDVTEAVAVDPSRVTLSGAASEYERERRAHARALRGLERVRPAALDDPPRRLGRAWPARAFPAARLGWRRDVRVRLERFPDQSPPR